ncbi:MAG: hypothetical protein ACYTF1_00250 [Planctomycetota bacterium]
MIPKNITRENILKAVNNVDEVGFPPSRASRKFLLEYQGKYYPPKYIVSIANRYANGHELPSSKFNGGIETNGFLKSLGFNIILIRTSKKDDDINNIF